MTAEKKNSYNSLSNITEQLKDLPQQIVNNHITRLDNDYLAYFKIEDIREHIISITGLSSDTLCRVHLKKIKNNNYSITIIGFDFQGLLSVISGLLTVFNFDIYYGKIFTYKKYSSTETSDSEDPVYYIQRKKIIDYLEVNQKQPETMPENCSDILQEQLNNYLCLIQKKKFQEVRYQLNKRIANYLGSLPESEKIKLLPIEVNINSNEEFTILHIKGHDTPAFLFSLSNALSLKGISINKIFIDTQKNIVNDTVYICDRYDRPITNPDYLNNLRIAVVLIKHFTFFLPIASDPDTAIRHFDSLLDEIISNRSSSFKILELNNELMLASLAKIFGSGDFFWEEFFRMQYSNFLPLLNNIDELKISKTKEIFKNEINEIKKNAASYEDIITSINNYKDKELFRMDLSHLIYPGKTFIEFSRELTDIADTIISEICSIIYQNLINEYGEPMTKKSLCRYAVLGLGKLGGTELGYASDIEIIVIYENTGFTASKNNSISNAEFFNMLVQHLKKNISAKADGIFEIDLRLRPYGKKGQLACTLKRWEKYYGIKGNAYDYERQLLIKLRPVYGDSDFCNEIMERRDNLIYSDNIINIENAVKIREKQIEKYNEPGKINAKFSPGGLVEIEYSVQFLQIEYGHKYTKLRTTNTVTTLERLLEFNIIRPVEFEKLYNSYAFLRRLINALRMVRGNADDLIIPDFETDEFNFLAKRLGYVRTGKISAEKQLKNEIDKVFKTVNDFYKGKFIEKKDQIFNDYCIPELLLKKDLDDYQIETVLSRLNVFNWKKIYNVLKNIFNNIKDKNSLVTVLVLAERYIARSPSPDKVLINLENYLLNPSVPEDILKKMIFHPRYIELLVLIFGYSDYLSNILYRTPGLIDYLTTEDALFKNKNYKHFLKEIRTHILPAMTDTEKAANLIREYKSREMLRIGLRDIYLNTDINIITREISDLTDAIIELTYKLAAAAVNKTHLVDRQAVIALGKLGGRELNYSSDIDLIFVTENLEADSHIRSEIMGLDNSLIKLLTESSPNGQLFRVDMRLRPYGKSGPLTGTFNYFTNYYKNKAAGWELQAWLKARTVSGNTKLGNKLITTVHSLIKNRNNREKIFSSIEEMRKKMLNLIENKDLTDIEVKLGPGGIRTIEFLVQHCQIKYCENYPDIISGNTMYVIDKLNDYKLLPPETAETLKKAYIFLRKIEHRIQLLGLQQRHELPTNEIELDKLAKRMGYEEVLQTPAFAQFQQDYRKYTDSVILMENSEIFQD